MTRKLSAGFICCGRACEGCTNDRWAGWPHFWVLGQKLEGGRDPRGLGRKEPNVVIVIVAKSAISTQIWRRGTPKKRAGIYDVVFACALAHT